MRAVIFARVSRNTIGRRDFTIIICRRISCTRANTNACNLLPSPKRTSTNASNAARNSVNTCSCATLISASSICTTPGQLNNCAGSTCALAGICDAIVLHAAPNDAIKDSFTVIAAPSSVPARNRSAHSNLPRLQNVCAISRTLFSNARKDSGIFVAISR